MTGELCRVITSDGLELQGLWMQGRNPTAVLHTHGIAGNFYENRFIDNVADAVRGRGMGLLTANNRGHDYMSDSIRTSEDGTLDYVQIGGIYEIFDQSITDVAAWVDFLNAGGVRRIILMGHSHAALKVTHYLSVTGDSRIAGLVLLSPSDDFGCQRARLGDGFDAALAVAEKLVASDHGRDLMPGHYFHYPVSAQTYLDIFRPDSPLRMFNISGTEGVGLEALGTIEVPVLVVVGSVEEAFVGDPREYLAGIEKAMGRAETFRGRVIEGAPHNYLGSDEQVAHHVGEWLDGLPGSVA